MERRKKEIGKREGKRGGEGKRREAWNAIIHCFFLSALPQGFFINESYSRSIFYPIYSIYHPASNIKEGELSSSSFG